MLDDALLERIARSQVGDGVRLWRQDRDTDSPLNTALDVVDEAMPQPYAVFWVDGGPPEMFTLPDLDPAIVLFSVRHLEMTGHLRGILTTPALDGEFLVSVAEQVTLRMLAELVLRHGDPGLACHLLAESLAETSTYPPPLTLWDLETEPISESYTSVWFYALLHELGHVAARDRAGTTPADDHYLGPLVEATLAAYLGADPPYLRGNSAGPDALDQAVLRAELDADLFSVQSLFIVTGHVFRRHSTRDRIQVGHLASDILLMFHLFHIINSCAAAAHAGRTPVATGLLGNVANGVRLNVVIDFLARYIASGGDPADGSQAGVANTRQQLIAGHERINERVVTFDRGHARALRHRFFPAECRLDAIGKLAEALEQDFTGAVARLEIRRFLALSESLRVRHHDLDLLADLAAARTNATDVLRQRQRAHRLAWITGDGVDMPFGLMGRDGHVVFVFATDVVADFFIQESRPTLRPGFELGMKVVISPTDQNVVIVIARSLPESERRRLHVVFEGSEDFDEQFRRLDDGTFWPDDDGR